MNRAIFSVNLQPLFLFFSFLFSGISEIIDEIPGMISPGPGCSPTELVNGNNSPKLLHWFSQRKCRHPLSFSSLIPATHPDVSTPRAPQCRRPYSLDAGRKYSLHQSHRSTGIHRHAGHHPPRRHLFRSSHHPHWETPPRSWHRCQWMVLPRPRRDPLLETVKSPHSG